MYYNLEAELSKHLDAGEKLIWVSQPKQGVVFRPSDSFLIPFSIVWCAFAFFWTISVASIDASSFFVIWGFMFICFGICFSFGRFFIDARMRKNTIYGLTENRIIIKSGIFSKSIKSLDIKSLTNIEFEEKSNGSGRILLGPRNPQMLFASAVGWFPGAQTTPALDLIEKVREVNNKIIELKNKQ